MNQYLRQGAGYIGCYIIIVKLPGTGISKQGNFV